MTKFYSLRRIWESLRLSCLNRIWITADIFKDAMKSVKWTPCLRRWFLSARKHSSVGNWFYIEIYYDGYYESSKYYYYPSWKSNWNLPMWHWLTLVNHRSCVLFIPFNNNGGRTISTKNCVLPLATYISVPTYTLCPI